MLAPSPFYVDDKRILHSDGVQDIKLPYVKNNVYQNEERIVMLQVDNGQRVMMIAMKELKYVPSLYVCIETDNWTLRWAPLSLKNQKEHRLVLNEIKENYFVVSAYRKG